MSAVNPVPTADDELLQLITEHQYYPERLALILWEWGEGELAGIDQPDAFQMDFLRELGEEMRASGFNGVDSVRKILRSIGSGRGIGKSALVSLVVVILLAAFPDAKITVMANSGDQLDKKTWPEIRKWMRRSIVSHWFEANSEMIYRLGARDAWFATRVTWNLENPQASAGQQNIGSVNVIIFDEASEIPDKIAEVSLSGLATGLPIGLAFGNPTMATGFFADSLSGRYAFGTWKSKTIDSRTCRFPNKEEIAEDIEHYGIDSDYVRVWRLGLPPKSNIAQYFDQELISAASNRKPMGLADDALVASCDFAWGGDDSNVIRFKHGLDRWSIPPIEIPGEQTRSPEVMIGKLAEVLTQEWPVGIAGRRKRVTMMFVDAAGIAGPVVMRLRQLGFQNIVEVNFNAHSIDPKYKNTRAMMLGRYKLALQQGAGISGPRLIEDMRQITIKKHIPLLFESKEEIKSRLGRSTDHLDAEILLEYMPVVPASVGRQALEYSHEKAYVPASPYS